MPLLIPVFCEVKTCVRKRGLLRVFTTAVVLLLCFPLPHPTSPFHNIYACCCYELLSLPSLLRDPACSRQLYSVGRRVFPPDSAAAFRSLRQERLWVHSSAQQCTCTYVYLAVCIYWWCCCVLSSLSSSLSFGPATYHASWVLCASRPLAGTPSVVVDLAL